MKHAALIESLESRRLYSVAATSSTTPTVIHETAGVAFTADLGQANPYSGVSAAAAKTAAAKTAAVETFVFHATIHWGDGKTSAGTAVQESGGTYDIIGTHTYAKTGRYHLVVTITRSPSGPGPQPEFIELYSPIHDTAEVSAG